MPRLTRAGAAAPSWAAATVSRAPPAVTFRLQGGRAAAPAPTFSRRAPREVTCADPQSFYQTIIRDLLMSSAVASGRFCIGFSKRETTDSHSAQRSCREALGPAPGRGFLRPPLPPAGAQRLRPLTCSTRWAFSRRAASTSRRRG